SLLRGAIGAAARLPDSRRNALRRRDAIPCALGFPARAARRRRARTPLGETTADSKLGRPGKRQSVTPRLDRLDRRYQEHHAHRREFVFGADERAGLMRELVGGPGQAEPDLGCRHGWRTVRLWNGEWIACVEEE